VAEWPFDLAGLLRRLVRRPPAAARARKPQLYHAVTLRTAHGACPAAKALATRRFLAAEAPRLPLAKCTSHRCECTFVHHDDRRHEVRRDPESHPSERPAGATHARKGSGRRKEDNLQPPTDEYFDLVSTAKLRKLVLSTDDKVDDASAKARADGK
jgi:hypothetical protein